MSRITRGAAVFAAVAALGAASAAPANAQDIDPQVNVSICNGQITVPCVIRTGYAVVDMTERLVFDTLDKVNPLVHRLCYIITEEDCNV
jgi:hypothetical protein